GEHSRRTPPLRPARFTPRHRTVRQRRPGNTAVGGASPRDRKLGVRRGRGGPGAPRVAAGPDRRGADARAVAGEVYPRRIPARQALGRVTRRHTAVPSHPGAAAMNTIDASMFDLFREEVKAHADTLTAGLIALEANATDPTRIEPLMRAAHSIKG